nr:hypothetical protein CFP56_25922 [Quercus suber]
MRALCPRLRTLSHHLLSQQSRQRTHVLYVRPVNASSRAVVLQLCRTIRSHTADETRCALQMATIEMEIASAKRCRGNALSILVRARWPSGYMDGRGFTWETYSVITFEHDGSHGLRERHLEYYCFVATGCDHAALTENETTSFSIASPRLLSLRRYLPRAPPGSFPTAVVNESEGNEIHAGGVTQAACRTSFGSTRLPYSTADSDT